MLGFFRSFFQSRLGVVITLSFLALIAIAFASADVTGNMFGGVAGGDRVASVGKAKIGSADLRQRVKNIFDSERQNPQNASLTMAQLLSGDALDQILDGMIGREAMYQFALKNGMHVSDRLVDSELAKYPDFKGPDGKFSQDIYNRLIAQRGYSDAAVRHDLAQGLVSTQLTGAAQYGAVLPPSFVKQYLAIFKERRTGSVALIPSKLFAPTAPPSAAALSQFYNANKARYMRPERRTVRYAEFDGSALKNVPAPTEAEIAKRYGDNSAVYAAAELRSGKQVIVLTEAAAKALAAEAAAGKPLEAAAAAKGLAASEFDRVTQQGLAGQTSPAVAAAVFAAAQGKVAAPAKGPLGWVVARVDTIARNPGKTLDQARPEIVAALAIEKRRAALNEVSTRIDEEIGSGSSLADAAKELGLQIVSTEPLTAGGEVYGKAGARAPEPVLPILNAAFGMEREGQPQLAEVQAGTKFIVFEVGQITASAAAPLDEIAPAVTNDYMLDQGSVKAREATEKVMAQLAKGVPLDAALKSLGVPVPAPEAIDMSRQQVMQAQQRVPPPIALLFAMAKNSHKRLEAPGKAGWYIVSVKNVIPGDVKDGDPMIAAAAGQFNTVAGREYAEQLAAAIRADVGSEKNPAAIAAVRTDLVGTGQ